MKVRRYHRPRRTIVILDGLAVLMEMVDYGKPITMYRHSVSGVAKRKG